jgi:transaldolase/glucose-6-phosphate isomerase
MSVQLQLHLNEYVDAVGERLGAWGRDDVLARMWARDHTLWTTQPVPELTDRLGWLELPDRLTGMIPELEGFGRELIADEIAHVVVLGMGGSSLAPEVFARTFGSAPGAPDLRVLDSTHPAAVLSTEAEVDLGRTVFIVASKSGTTIEPLSFMEYFWSRVSELGGEAGRHFVATTDPGSDLEALAADRGFRRTFVAPPDVGGRYSALTEFGMVPAAAIGADLTALAAAAMAAGDNNSATAGVAQSDGCRLGAAMGELARAGRDKVTFLTSPDIAALPAWIEQLIAESTGKRGTGIIPIGGEQLGAADTYGADRFFMVIETAEGPPIDTAAISDHPRAVLSLDSTTDIAGVMYTFEVATALAGSVLRIQPFDQPDVQLAKELARDAMAGDLDLSAVVQVDALDPGLVGQIADWLNAAEAGDYVGIHAFIEPTTAASDALGAARLAVRDARGLATTLDFGPRFLHSTGQLHKGGPDSGLFLGIVDDPTPALPVPTTDYDFAELVSAQAFGDHLALRRRGRRTLLISLGDSGMEGLHRVSAAVGAAARSGY